MCDRGNIITTLGAMTVVGSAFFGIHYLLFRRDEREQESLEASTTQGVSGDSLVEPDALAALSVSYPAPRRFTADDLRRHVGADGSDVMISVRGVVYRVTQQFYGAGQPYSVYAGHDITVPLAKGVVGVTEGVLDLLDQDWRLGWCMTRTADVDGGEARYPAHQKFTVAELASLSAWEKKFRRKYAVVGWFGPFERPGAAAPPPNRIFRSRREILAYVLEMVDTTDPEPLQEDTAARPPTDVLQI